MSTQKTNNLNLIIISILIVAFITVSQSACGLTEAQNVKSNTAPNATPPKYFKFLQIIGDPCRFVSAEGYQMPPDKEIYELKNAGFPEAVSLEEAVAVFNKFAQCDATGKMQPPLRSEEVLASIRGWICETDLNVKDKKICAEFRQIAETGKLPKGGFLEIGDAGVVNYKGYDVDAWQINLYLRLDKNRRDIKGVPNFSRLIRLNYLSSKPTEMQN